MKDSSFNLQVLHTYFFNGCVFVMANLNDYNGITNLEEAQDCNRGKPGPTSSIFLWISHASSSSKKFKMQDRINNCMIFKEQTSITLTKWKIWHFVFKSYTLISPIIVSLLEAS